MSNSGALPVHPVHEEQEAESKQASRMLQDLSALAVAELLLELRTQIDDLKRTNVLMRAELACSELDRRKNEKFIAQLYEYMDGIKDEATYIEARSKMRAILTRRSLEYNLPTYFWRPDDGKSTEEMLRWRAKYLIIRKGAGIEDIWNFLEEFNREYSGKPVSAEKLKQIIREAKNA